MVLHQEGFSNVVQNKRMSQVAQESGFAFLQRLISTRTQPSLTFHPFCINYRDCSGALIRYITFVSSQSIAANDSILISGAILSYPINLYLLSFPFILFSNKDKNSHRLFFLKPWFACFQRKHASDSTKESSYKLTI